MKRMITVQYTGVLRVETDRPEETDAVADAVFAVAQNVQGVKRVESVTVENVPEESTPEKPAIAAVQVDEPGAE